MRFLRNFVIVALVIVLVGCAKVDPNLKVQVSEQANPWTHLNLYNNPDNFQFAIVSDRTGGHRPGVFAAAVEKLNLLKPEFVISVGDLIEGYTQDEGELNSQWDEFDGLVNKLQMNFFFYFESRNLQFHYFFFYIHFGIYFCSSQIYHYE